MSSATCKPDWSTCRSLPAAPFGRFRQPALTEGRSGILEMRHVRFLGLILVIAAAPRFSNHEVLAGADGGTEQVIFEDRFASQLAPGWSWVHEDPKSWRVEKDQLLIRSLPGSLYRSMNNCKNLLLRAPPDTGSEPLAIEVRLRSQPKSQFENAGIIWYRDDDNFVILSKEHYTKGAEPAVDMIREQKVDGKVTGGVPHSVPYDDEEVSLRLVIEDTNFTGQYRKTDKEEWKTVGTIKLASVEGNPRIGLATAFGTEEVVRWVHFSNFRISKGGTH